MALAFAVAHASQMPDGAPPGAAAAPPKRATAIIISLRNATGEVAGNALVRDSGGSVLVEARIAGLPPGSYGAAFHSIGLCEGPGFASTGPHWNPAGRQHGTANPAGPHLGDLPDIIVGADGRGRLLARVEGAAFDALVDEDGGALVIHADPDDRTTDPSGNTGPGLICGALLRKR